MPKKRGKRKREKLLRGLSSNHVDGVCEGVYASHVLINIDSHSDSLWSARLKYGARSVVPCYSEVLLSNQRDPIASRHWERCWNSAIVSHWNLSSSRWTSSQIAPFNRRQISSLPKLVWPYLQVALPPTVFSSRLDRRSSRPSQKSAEDYYYQSGVRVKEQQHVYRDCCSSSVSSDVGLALSLKEEESWKICASSSFS